jgi:hypothetical protein
MRLFSGVIVFALSVRALAAAVDPVLIIYNGGFALVRQPLELDLRVGENEVATTAVTRSLDPASVILRDPSRKADWQIIEQRFRSEPITEQRMLSRMEGQTIPFRWRDHGEMREVQGKILRGEMEGRQRAEAIIEVDGKVQFSLPGTAVFPGLPGDALLRPELRWRINATKAGKSAAEFSYLTEGFAWTADYNAVMQTDGKISELTGWVTLKNGTQTDFRASQVKLVAGDVKRLSKGDAEDYATTERVIVTGSYIPAEQSECRIETRRFDEFHEFALPRSVQLVASETTQIELVRATDITLLRSFVYDGANMSLETVPSDPQLDAAFGAESNSKVLITSEFKNDRSNRLGVPLPKGRLHFYRYDAEGRLQFTGDSAIGNIAEGEMVRAVTGNAFDLVGERRQIDFRVDDDKRTAEESFEIKVRNQRKEAAEVRVIEHPMRWRQWEITAQSLPMKKINAYTIEFRLPVAAGGEGVMTYTIRYSQFPRPRG